MDVNVSQCCAKSVLLAGDAAHVAGSLAEANLELGAAPARAGRLILDCGGGRNRRQGVASVIAGVEAVAANALIARPASDRNILAKLNRAAVGAGLKARLTGLAVVAGGDAGAAIAAQLDCAEAGSQANAVARRVKQAAAIRRMRMSPSQHLRSGRSGDDSRAFGVLSWATRRRSCRREELKVKMTPSLSLRRYSLHPRRQNRLPGMGR